MKIVATIKMESTASHYPLSDFIFALEEFAVKLKKIEHARDVDVQYPLVLKHEDGFGECSATFQAVKK